MPNLTELVVVLPLVFAWIPIVVLPRNQVEYAYLAHLNFSIFPTSYWSIYMAEWDGAVLDQTWIFQRHELAHLAKSYGIGGESGDSVRKLLVTQSFNKLVTQAYYSYDPRVLKQKLRSLQYRQDKQLQEKLKSMGITADVGRVDNKIYEW